MTPSKISGLLEKISAVINNQDWENLPQIEFDLMMQHLRELYDKLYQLRNKRHSFIHETDTGNTGNGENIKPSVLPIKKTFLSNKHLLLNDTQPENENIEYTKKAAASNSSETQKSVEKPEKSLKAPSINEGIKHSGSLNEKLKPTNTEVHHKLASKPLKDLIDLNNRFVLLNDLFKGNAEAFSSTIQHIDSLQSYQDAETFIQSKLVSNYYWEQSSPSAKIFMKLVKQKFGIT